MIAAFAATDGFVADVSAQDSKPAQVTAQLRSPDGNLFLKVALSENGEPLYSLDYKGRAVVLPSRLGLELRGEIRTLNFNGVGKLSEPGAPVSLYDGFSSGVPETSEFDETWKPVCPGCFRQENDSQIPPF